MKKLMSIVLCICLVFTSFSVLADNDDAELIKNALLKVKEKITISPELSEFSGNIANYDGEINIHMYWYSPDEEKSISLICDEEGRIHNYNDDSFEYSEKSISSVSKSSIIAFAESFIKKALPEAFISENDGLFYDESSYNASGNLIYSLNFQREKNSVPVKNDYAHISVCIINEEMYIRNMYVSFDYDAVFETNETEIDNYTEKYTELFPLEMIYVNKRNPEAKTNDQRYIPTLVYRIKDNAPGYMDISSGEIIYEYADDAYRKESITQESAADSVNGAGSPALTEEELKEINNIENLLPLETVEKSLNMLPYLGFPGKMKLESKRLVKNISNEYIYNLDYSYDNNDEYQYFGVTLNAKSGEILRISNSKHTNKSDSKELTEMQISGAQKKIKEFLNKICPEKLSQTVESNMYSTYSNVKLSFTRLVNGVKYIDNGISAGFNVNANVITGFNLNFTEGEFKSPEDAVNEGEAYKNILEYSPVEPLYICVGDTYKKAVSLVNHNVILDAISGEIINPDIKDEYNYSDIEEHWISEAATKLGEIQIGLPGENLEPEKEITQEELLRLWSMGVWGKYMSTYTGDDLYDYCVRENIISKDEISPASAVKREDSFIYLTRFMGYDKIAKINGIYKVDYADINQLSAEKLGYAAILTGLNIINGNGGNLRPEDNITRAEAIMMIYKYLLSV